MLPLGKAILLLLFPATLVAQTKSAEEFVIRGEAQGTTYTVRYFAKDSIVKKNAVDSILKVIDRSMSLYDPNSLISKFNASPTGLQLDEHMHKVVSMALSVNHNSKGYFDITIAPLMNLWGMGVKPATKIPDSAAVNTVKACVGNRYLQLSRKGFLSKAKPCVQIDLNGIAQGYSVDLVSAYIRKKKITSFMVEIGGEIYVGGPKPDGSFFKIGIEAPLSNSAEPFQRILSIKKGAVTTSGNYRKYIEGRKINHLINPHTGYPVENANISVTIFADNALTADGFDNAVMTGQMPYNAYLEKRYDLAIYLIYRMEDGTIKEVMSDNFVKLLANKPK